MMPFRKDYLRIEGEPAMKEMMANELNESRKKAAAKRVLKAETLLYRAAEFMEKAQAEISVIVSGLNQNYAKIGNIRQNVKTQMYDLERCRESGHCMMDETVLRKS